MPERDWANDRAKHFLNGRIFTVLLQLFTVRFTQQRLNARKLVGLKSAGGAEVTAKFLELMEFQRENHLNLVHHGFRDGVDADQPIVCGGYVAVFYQIDKAVELIDQLFEPQFIRLMRNDEEVLVAVFARRRGRLLQSE
ncbi:hypothetical protein D3C72_1887260 [compost metagenome]